MDGDVANEGVLWTGGELDGEGEEMRGGAEEGPTDILPGVGVEEEGDCPNASSEGVDGDVVVTGRCTGGESERSGGVIREGAEEGPADLRGGEGESLEEE